MSQTAANKLDDALTGSARSVREAGGAIGDAAARAAEKLNSTAAYVRSHDPRAGVEMRQMIRRRPAVSVAAAVAAGFLIGVAVTTLGRLLCVPDDAD